MIPPAWPRRAPTHGFTLVEVTLALGIAVFCLVVIFGLLNVGVNASSASIEQTVATNIVSAVAGDLRTAKNPAPKGSSQTTMVYRLTIPASVTTAAASVPSATPMISYLDASGQPLAAIAGARYQLNVWMKPGLGRGATLARVLVTWPPGAALPAGSVETLVALDRN